MLIRSKTLFGYTTRCFRASISQAICLSGVSVCIFASTHLSICLMLPVCRVLPVREVI